MMLSSYEPPLVSCTVAPAIDAPAPFFTSTRREFDVCGERKSFVVTDVFGASTMGCGEQEDEMSYPVDTATVIVYVSHSRSESVSVPEEFVVSNWSYL